MRDAVVPLYPQGIHSKTLCECLKLRITPSPTAIVILPIRAPFPLKASALTLLFGTSGGSASWLLCEPLRNQIRVTWTQAVHLITQTATLWLMEGSLFSLEAPDTQMTHILGGAECDRVRFHHAIQNGVQFKTCELFTSGVFHLIFLDCNWPWVTETVESEMMDKGGYCLSWLGKEWKSLQQIRKQKQERIF